MLKGFCHKRCEQTCGRVISHSPPVSLSLGGAAYALIALWVQALPHVGVYRATHLPFSFPETSMSFYFFMAHTRPLTSTKPPLTHFKKQDAIFHLRHRGPERVST